MLFSCYLVLRHNKHTTTQQALITNIQNSKLIFTVKEQSHFYNSEIQQYEITGTQGTQNQTRMVIFHKQINYRKKSPWETNSFSWPRNSSPFYGTQRFITNYKMYEVNEQYLSALGNWALVTRNVEISRSWRRCTKLFISGYIIGSPTNDNAQCFTSIPSANLSDKTPGTPEIMSYVWHNKINFITIKFTFNKSRSTTDEMLTIHFSISEHMHNKSISSRNE